MDTTRVVHLAKGHVLYHKGEECDTMFVLRSGRVTLYLNYGSENQFALVSVSEPGSSLGEMGLLEGETRNGTAVADEDSVLIEISRENFAQFLSRYPEEGVKIVSDLAHRFKTVTEELKNTQTLVAEIIRDVQTGQESVKPSLKERLRKLADFFLDIPSDVPPDLYVNVWSRNHSHMH